jgi:hypothetical protein
MRKGKEKELGQWNIAYNNNKKNNNKKNINYNYFLSAALNL